MGSNAQAVLELPLLEFFNVMQAGKHHTFIGESLPYKKNAQGRAPIIFKNWLCTLDRVFIMVSFYYDAKLMHKIGK